MEILHIKRITETEMRKSLRFFRVQFEENDLPLLWLPIHLIPQHFIINYFKNSREALYNKTSLRSNKRNTLYEICSTESTVVLNSLAKQFVTRRGLELPPSKKNQLFRKLSALPKLFPGESIVKELQKEILIETIRQKREKLRFRLREAEFDLNLKMDCTEAVKIINNVSCDPFPNNFTFVNVNQIPENIELVTIVCQCTECCCCSESCCHYESEIKSAYTIDKRIKWPFITHNKNMSSLIVHECYKCKCGPGCRNRVVQRESHVKLEVYYSSRKGCGWGIRAAERIAKNTFVLRYAGEVITASEARKRSSKSLYIFDMDMEKPDNQQFGDFAIDSDHLGNLGRFVNHSCDPNLLVLGVHVSSSDSQLHELAFFTIRDVEQGEQLCIDYGQEYKIIKPCKCGSVRCRKDLTKTPEVIINESSFTLSLNSTNPYSQDWSLNISE